MMFFFFSSRRRHTRCSRDWSSDVCSSDLPSHGMLIAGGTELLNWFRLGVAAPDHVVDLAGIEELKRIAIEGDKIGRASCRERVEISGVGVALKKKRKRNK